MTTPQEKLAEALKALKSYQDKGLQAISASALNRSHREHLLRAGFLRQVVRGWYVPSRPDERPGDTTPWYASMREFVAGYCNERFKQAWHLNPDHSLLLHSGERTLPKQLQIWATGGNNQQLALPHGCSLFIYRASVLLPASAEADAGGIRLVELPHALVAAAPAFFTQNRIAAQVALALVPDASAVLRVLLAGGHAVAAGRLAGAFRAIGRADISDDILGAMRGAGYTITEANPFEPVLPTAMPGDRTESPYVLRMRLMWVKMREIVIRTFPQSEGKPKDIDKLMEEVDARYVTDAYHSLSIEGYRVSAGLIEKVRDGRWNPDDDAGDRETRDTMAARGYYETHNLIKEDITRILNGDNPGTVFRKGLSRWYQALFSPSVQAGILRPEDLAGYRNNQVYIRGALHVPVSHDAVRDCMPALFELMEAEEVASVRAVLGHLIFVYIHPYMDGNGRLARFLMNAMLVPAGYVWTVIPVERRTDYMNALEQASSFDNIEPFATLVGELCEKQKSVPLPRPKE